MGYMAMAITMAMAMAMAMATFMIECRCRSFAAAVSHQLVLQVTPWAALLGLVWLLMMQHLRQQLDSVQLMSMAAAA
jgi:hypothetical protein